MNVNLSGNWGKWNIGWIPQRFKAHQKIDFKTIGGGNGNTQQFEGLPP